MSSLRIFIAQSGTVLRRLSWQPLSRILPSTPASQLQFPLQQWPTAPCANLLSSTNMSSFTAHTFANHREPTPDLVKPLMINAGGRSEHDTGFGWDYAVSQTAAARQRERPNPC
jgi:hypothetical protein